MPFSPSGKKAVPNEGPLDAEIVLVGDGPHDEETSKGRLLVGRGGKIVDVGLSKAGIDRAAIRAVSIVPVKAPGNKFIAHDARDVEWGRELFQQELQSLTNAKVIVAMGQNALQWLTQLSPITKWRGSVLTDGLGTGGVPSRENYLDLAPGEWNKDIPFGAKVVPTFDPSYVSRQFNDHPWFIMDMQRAKRMVTENPKHPYRHWYFNDLEALTRFADTVNDPEHMLHTGLISIDTESYPTDIVGFATHRAVYVVEWDEKYRDVLEKIFSSPFLLKMAHNLQHDWTWLKKRKGIDVSQPWFDTMGGAHVLHPELEVNLSPAIATRYTDWSYHKWMVDYDALWYNGLDCVVAYDAYWPIMDELIRRDLYDVAKHDHSLLQPLLDMQWKGFKVDEHERQQAEVQLSAERDGIIVQLQATIAPIVEQRIQKFDKPHLFRVQRSCSCCGGGKQARTHCWRCGGLDAKPKKKQDYANCSVGFPLASQPTACYCPKEGTPVPLAGQKVSALRESLPSCRVCAGTGKVTKELPFNPDSSDQVADILYRGAGIPARKYKGEETVRVGQLEPLIEKYPLVQGFVDYARKNADYETIARLSAGSDSRLHCVFDPLVGTVSGRVAGKEGLVEQGTNPMNIPKPARRLVVPDEGMVFLNPDMAQIEARAIAVISRDEELKRIFSDGEDFHILVRDDMIRLGVLGFTRDQSKRLNFAVPYGARAAQLAKELIDEAYRKGAGATNLTPATTQLMIDNLLNTRYKGVARWQRELERQILENKSFRSITGRVFEFLDYVYDKKTKGVKYEIMKKAYSREPQDIGAWILGEGMVEVFNFQEQWKNSGPLISVWPNRLQGLIHVHDALLFQCLEKDVEEASEIIRKAFTREKWGMKFTTSIKVGRNWAEVS